ncbi:MAG: beta-ketoacyl-ACP synthase II [Bacteroidales bacterium]|nr:beta-ketoacyl-ACP synthase II [Bacteroidales bacterium]
MELKRVVVTGIGAITPLGNSVDEFWENLAKGVSGSELITRFDVTNYKTKFACQVKDFDPLQWLDKKEARKMDLFVQFSIAAASGAIKHSGIDLANTNLDRIGAIWASGIGGIGSFTEEVGSFVCQGRIPKLNPFFIPKIITNIAAGYISILWGLRGPSYCTTSACASATHAMIDAFNLIRLGKADVFVTGGAEAPVNEVGLGGFNAMHATSTNNDEYKTASRPFDVSRDGFVMGEGGVGLILEELEHAKKRGATIYAEMIGGGMTSDAYHLTAPHPEGLGAINVMKETLLDAGIGINDVQYINLHGTSTPLGDLAETKAVKELFGNQVYNINLSSTKSMTGHLLGAAGAAEAAAAILAIYKKIIPPTINNKVLDPNIDSKLNLTLNEAQHRDVKVALSNTFGFGGHNACVALKEYQE